MKEIVDRELKARQKWAALDDEDQMVPQQQPQVVNQTSRLATVNAIPVAAKSTGGDEALSPRDKYLKSWEGDRELEKEEEKRLGIKVDEPTIISAAVEKQIKSTEGRSNEAIEKEAKRVREAVEKAESDRQRRKELAEKEERKRAELERKWAEEEEKAQKAEKEEKTRKAEEMERLRAEEEKEAARLKEIEARKKEIEEELARERRHLEDLQRIELSLRSGAGCPQQLKPPMPKAAIQYEELVAKKGQQACRSPSKSPTPSSFDPHEKQRIAELHRIKELKMLEEQKMRELSMLQNAKRSDQQMQMQQQVPLSRAIIPAPPAFLPSPSASPDPLNRNGQLVTSLPPLPPQKLKQQVTTSE